MKNLRQKFLFLSFIGIMLFCSVPQVQAKTVEVQSLTTFSTANPPSTITIKIVSSIPTKKGVIPANTVVIGELVDVKSPKRLKRDASFSFRPTYFIGSDGVNHKIRSSYKGKYTTPIDKAQIAGKAAKSVGNLFVKGFSIGVSAVEGAIKNEEDNRLKSSVVSAYEASPVSYVEKGQELEIKKDDIFYLKFPESNDDDNDN